jgi:DNA repair photolyase
MIMPLKGRGSSANIKNRFIDRALERDEEWNDSDDPAPSTQIMRQKARTAISYNDSPDLGMGASVNPYRGCEHGCIYCYARPTHEYFGLSAGLDFETKILVKDEVPVLLRKELSSSKWKPQVVMMSGVTDCYQPVEKRLELTRQCLEVFVDFRNPVALITKNRLVMRDIDILKRLAEYRCASVWLSVTTLDRNLATVMEPRTSLPEARLEAIAALADAGIPVGVNVAPVIPGLNDHEIPAILKACHKAGARSAGYVPLRLPYGVKDLFENWLGRHFPGHKDKVLHRIREMRGGKLNDPEFGSRMEGTGLLAEQIGRLFEISKKKAGFEDQFESELTTQYFRKPQEVQLELF